MLGFIPPPMGRAGLSSWLLVQAAVLPQLLQEHCGSEPVQGRFLYFSKLLWKTGIEGLVCFGRGINWNPCMFLHNRHFPQAS